MEHERASLHWRGLYKQVEKLGLSTDEKVPPPIYMLAFGGVFRGFRHLET